MIYLIFIIYYFLLIINLLIILDNCFRDGAILDLLARVILLKGFGGCLRLAARVLVLGVLGIGAERGFCLRTGLVLAGLGILISLCLGILITSSCSN